MVVPPCETVNVTVPELTVPEALVTVAERVTFWALELKGAEALLATVVVAAWLTVKVWVLSLLAAKPPPPPYEAVMV